MRPGHPVVLAQLTGRRPVPVIGVPGYPAAAERVFTSFALPLLRRLLAVDQPTTAGIAARLGTAIHSATHLDEQLRLRLARVPHPQTGRETLVATPLRRGAAELDSMIKAEATLRIPTGHTTLAAGSEAWIEPAGGAAGAGTILVSGLISPAVTADHTGPRQPEHGALDRIRSARRGGNAPRRPVPPGGVATQNRRRREQPPDRRHDRDPRE
jgi:hypothetical protein